PGFKRPIFNDKSVDDEPRELPVTVTATMPEYMPYVTDSPPARPTKAVPPYAGYANESEFTKSYTYKQYELPTWAATGTLGVAPTAIPKPTWAPGGCFMMTGGPTLNFTLVDHSFVPVVWERKNNEDLGHLTLLPLPRPPIPLWHPLYGLDPLEMPLDAWYLQPRPPMPHRPDRPEPPDGLYDMILVAGTARRILAIQRNGEFVLVDIARQADAHRDGLVTTMFRTDCEGRITIEVDGQPWAWSNITEVRDLAFNEPAPTAEDTLLDFRLKAVPGNPDPERNYFRAVPNGHWVSQKARGDLVPHDLALRGSDAAPKCPAEPGGIGLMPHLLEQNQPGQGNLCTYMADKWEDSPFNFTRACDIQSRCYDRCDKFGWESCNDLFIGQAMTYCFDHWARTHWDIV
ncbi:hypothetical protein E4U43_006791, partial [Claviceps pusilla]